MEGYPVLRGFFLDMFKDWSKLIGTLVSEQNDNTQFDTQEAFGHLRPGDETFHSILQALFNRTPLASWTGDVEFVGYNFGPVHVALQHAKLEDVTPEKKAAIRDILEFLLVKREGPGPQGLGRQGLNEVMVEGQLVDCPVPSRLPPMYAKALRHVSPYAADLPLDADGSLDLVPLYAEFVAQPDITYRHINCLARVLMRKNVAKFRDGVIYYDLGFLENHIKKVNDFLRIRPEWHEWVKDEIGYGQAIPESRFDNPPPDYFPPLLALHEPILGESPVDVPEIFDLFESYVRNLGMFIKPTVKKVGFKHPGQPTSYEYNRDGRLVLQYPRVPLEHFVRFFIDHGIPPEDLAELLLPISNDMYTSRMRDEIKKAISADVAKIVARLAPAAVAPPALPPALPSSNVPSAYGGSRRRKTRRKIERTRRRK